MSAEKAAKPLQNAKHEAVLQAYFADPERIGYRCYTSVYRKSGQAAAKTAFSRLLRNADFAGRLKFLDAGITAKVVASAAVSIEQVVAELCKLGFANVKNYIRLTDEGEPAIDFGGVTDEQFAALSEVTVEDFVDGRSEPDEALEPQPQGGALRRQRGREVRKVRFKLHNKQPALVSILEHLGGFPASRHADPDGRALGTGAAEASSLSDLEVARRLAFMLARGERAKGKR
jgi:phage terminase small subunit